MRRTIQTIRVEHDCGFMRSPEGDEVFFHRSAVTSPEPFVTLAIGMVVEFESESAPKGPRATTLTVVPEIRQ